MTDIETRNGAETQQLAPSSSSSQKPAEKKSYIDSLTLKNSSRPADDDKIIEIAKRNEAVQFERVGELFDAVAKYYGDR